MSECCVVAGDRKAPTPARRARGVIAWAVPGAILVSVPKCPACLAAHVALWTGLGLSLPAAAFLRGGLLILCVATWLYLILGRLLRIGADSRHLRGGPNHGASSR
ncbi:hypothetical protein [Aquisphaera insulae]|uniref:hypothetical protein n=1 Tax=Aquisphaera insulae TaxID=2712864 RepID=UPI0013EE0117|nr:hypothetical protein [Aquisphaera insulae]